MAYRTFAALLKEVFCMWTRQPIFINCFSLVSIFFLSRPRRFGKSLLISTLKEIFNGSRELFAGLWIEDKIDWKPTSVIHLDFSQIVSREISLEEAVHHELDAIAKDHGIDLEATTIHHKFRELIRILGQENKVAILIDEYDKPIVEYIDELETASTNRETMRSLYSAIKGNDEHIGFFLMTGVSKFTKVSIFSDLNNLNDISFDENFGELLGYTQAELESYFAEPIAQLKEKFKEGYPDILGVIKTWYNGYSWDGKHFVYNPFSILNLCQKQTFMDYWFATGTPNWLIKLFRNRNYQILDLQDFKLHLSELHTFDVDSLEVSILLLQTGYLTVKELDVFKQILTLGFPNKEVEVSFSMNLLGIGFDVEEKNIGGYVVGEG